MGDNIAIQGPPTQAEPIKPKEYKALWYAKLKQNPEAFERHKERQRKTSLNEPVDRRGYTNTRTTLKL